MTIIVYLLTFVKKIYQQLTKSLLISIEENQQVSRIFYRCLLVEIEDMCHNNLPTSYQVVC